MPSSEQKDVYTAAGHLAHASSRLETELNNCIHVCVESALPDAMAVVLDLLKADEKLEPLGDIAVQLYDAQDPEYIEFTEWRARFGEILFRRDALLRKVFARPSFIGADAIELHEEAERIEGECADTARWVPRLAAAISRMKRTA